MILGNNGTSTGTTPIVRDYYNYNDNFIYNVNWLGCEIT